MAFMIYWSALLLIMISLIHVYWAYGGSWGSRAAVPEKVGGGSMFAPGKTATLAVAVLLLIACFVLLAQSEAAPFLDAGWFSKWGCRICAVVFFVRAVGDFHYVGFSKRIRNTVFAVNDTWLYSPLCLILAISFLIALK